MTAQTPSGTPLICLSLSKYTQVLPIFDPKDLRGLRYILRFPDTSPSGPSGTAARYYTAKVCGRMPLRQGTSITLSWIPAPFG